MDERFKFLVSKYLDDKLSDPELAEFEKYLEDSSCNSYFKKAEFANQLIEEGFQNLLDEAEKKVGFNKEENEFPDEIIADSAIYAEKNNPFIREKVKNAHRQMILKRQKKRILIFGSVAAAFVIMLAVFWPSPQPITPQQQSKKYYKKYEYIILRSSDESELLYKKAVSEYMLNYYTQSSATCRKILSSGTQNPHTHLLYGLNLMEQDSMQLAIDQFNIFTSYTKLEDGIYFPVALWYTSLCYLSLNNPHQAIIELQKLQILDNSFKDSYPVEELLQDLNK